MANTRKQVTVCPNCGIVTVMIMEDDAVRKAADARVTALLDTLVTFGMNYTREAKIIEGLAALRALLRGEA